MTAPTYKNPDLDDLVIGMTALAALKRERYAMPLLGIPALIAGGTPVMTTNLPDVSMLRYEQIPPRPPTYERLLERTGEAITPRGQDRVVFAWTPDALTSAPSDRVVGCVQLEDLAATRDAITAYRSRGLAPERIVVAGKISDLPDDVYDELTEIGVLLEELDWERYGDAARPRLERAMEPFYRTLLHLGPALEDVTSRPYRYTPTPTPVAEVELRRLGDLLRGDAEMFD